MNSVQFQISNFKFQIGLALLLSCWPALAAQQTINIGTVANDKTGDPLRTAFTKANDNFTELYTSVAAKLTAVQATNIANAVKAAAGLVVGGDSLSTEYQSPTATVYANGQGKEWPKFLLTNALWRMHLPEVNHAYGGALASGWASTDYTTQIRPVVTNFVPWSYVYSHEAGINDVAAGHTLTQITNDLATVWAMARADKMLVAAWSIGWDTNNIGNATKLAVWTNANFAIASMSGLYDFYVPMPPITNAALQLLDNVHPTATQNVALAWAFANAVQPTLSSLWANFNLAQLSLDILNVNTITRSYGFQATGLFAPDGAGTEMSYDDGPANSGGAVAAIDHTHGVYRGLTLYGSQIDLYDMSRLGIVLHGNTTVSNLTLSAITNQLTFGKTNPPPVSTVAPTKWIDVRVTGDATLYRLPLYQ